MNVNHWDDEANLEELRALHVKSHATHQNNQPYAQQQQALRACTEAARRIADAFAASRGWKRGGSHFSLPQLAGGRPGRAPADYGWSPTGLHSNTWDHPEFFRERQRPYRPAAAVVHVYVDVHDGPAFAKEHGLVFEPLPWSWYCPDACQAGLYRRDGVT